MIKNPSLPLISIITVVYNGEKYLEQTIQSVINQTYNNIEYIIIDGGSTDGTLNIIKKYEQYIDYWQSEPDKGIYDAMNKGISFATGDIIGLLNADDWYENNAIQTIADNANKGELIVANCINWKKGRPFLKKNKSLRWFKYDMCINHPATFVKASVYKELGMFPLDYQIASDYYFVVNCYKNRKKFHFIDSATTNFREVGISRQKRKIMYIELMKVQEEHQLNSFPVGLFFLLIKYFFYLYKMIFKKL